MNILQLVILLCSIESGGRVNPPDGDGGKAVGCLQIHAVMVRECNRITEPGRFTYADRRDPVKSVSMAMAFLIHQKKRKPDATRAQLLMSWNSGSITKPCTKDYRRKVSRALKN